MRSGHRRSKGDDIAESLQLVDIAPLAAGAVKPVEIVGAEIGGGLVVTQQMVEDHQHPVRHRHDRFLLAPSMGEAVKLSREIVA